MSTVTASTSAASAFSHKELPSREVSLTYYLNGKQQALCFKTEDPTFRELISILREQDRPFRIVYM
jgi:hypothetical protein